MSKLSRRGAALAIAVALCAASSLSTGLLHQTSAVAASAAVTTATIDSAAQSTGVESRMALWYVQDGVAHVGLTSIESNDVAALTSLLGSKVVVFQQERFHTLGKTIPLKSPEGQDVAKAIATHDFSALQAQPQAVTPNALSPGQYPPFIDNPAYLGGDRIFAQEGNAFEECTVLSDWGGYMLTAGHCGGNGQTWYQGFINSMGFPSDSVQNEMGVAKSRIFGDSQLDAELIAPGGSASYGTGVWLSGGGHTPPSRHQIGRAAPAVGSTVCADGSFTGYVCGAKVTLTNTCANTVNSSTGVITKTCGLDSATNSSAVLAGYGDSGGPVLSNVTSSSVQIAGMIVAGTNNGHTLLFDDSARLATAYNLTPRT